MTKSDDKFIERFLTEQRKMHTEEFYLMQGMFAQNTQRLLSGLDTIFNRPGEAVNAQYMDYIPTVQINSTNNAMETPLYFSQVQTVNPYNTDDAMEVHTQMPITPTVNNIINSRQTTYMPRSASPSTIQAAAIPTSITTNPRQTTYAPRTVPPNTMQAYAAAATARVVPTNTTFTPRGRTYVARLPPPNTIQASASSATASVVLTLTQQLRREVYSTY